MKLSIDITIKDEDMSKYNLTRGNAFNIAIFGIKEAFEKMRCDAECEMRD